MKHKRKDEACLVYETFLRALISIAKLLYPLMSPVDAFIKLNEDCFSKLKDQSDQENEFENL